MTMIRAMRRVLALALCAGIVSSSVEPSYAQVRVIAAQSAGFPGGRAALPSGALLAPAALDAAVYPAFNLMSPAFAAAPALSAASLPLPAALAAAPRAAAAASAPAEAAAATPNPILGSFAPAASAANRGGSAESLSALALTAGDAATFFDQAQARQRGPAGLEFQAPAASSRRGAGLKRWVPAAAASFLLLGPLAAGLHAEGVGATNGGSVAGWGDIAKGVAMVVPLVVIGGLGLFRRYRDKQKEARDARRLVEPLHKPVQPELRHFLTNLGLGAVGIAIVATLFGPQIQAFNHFIDTHGIGLLHWLHITGWKNVVASLVMMDFIDWSIHYASHRFPLLWRLHKVHHTDLDYDLSTTFRMHPLETILGMLGGLAEFALIGPNLLAMTIADLIAITQGQYQHANIRMPEWLEKWMSYLFITSHKHYIHHSMSAEDYDTNYGHIFSFWDKLFGTYKNYAPGHLTGKMSPGLRDYPNPQELGIIKLLLMPFERQEPRPAKEKSK
ncbi:MAG: sterol desaturase family protein [Elusimicrobiota bacterium]